MFDSWLLFWTMIGRTCLPAVGSSHFSIILIAIRLIPFLTPMVYQHDDALFFMPPDLVIAQQFCRWVFQKPKILIMANFRLRLFSVDFFDLFWLFSRLFSNFVFYFILSKIPKTLILAYGFHIKKSKTRANFGLWLFTVDFLGAPRNTRASRK